MPDLRATRNCSGVRISFHSASVLTTFLVGSVGAVLDVSIGFSFEDWLSAVQAMSMIVSALSMVRIVFISLRGVTSLVYSMNRICKWVSSVITV